MTVPKQSPLVLCGRTIKLRLQAERTAYGSAVHVDWVRFTVHRRAAQLPDADVMFPQAGNVWDEKTRMQRLMQELASIGDGGAGMEAAALAERVCECMGRGFEVAAEPAKGHDFYGHRIPLLLNGEEVAWVGFGASGSSPRQISQAKTLHVNLHGAACTFAEIGWRERIADLIDELEAKVTRVDLALDFFDGYTGTIQRVWDEWEAGVMNVQGKRPGCKVLGRWPECRERSFYLGSKEAGKQTCVYEKGHLLGGAQSVDPWVRFELRYGDKLRVLSSDMLRRPADFFAGASDWHEAVLAEAQEFAEAESIKTAARLADATVDAATARVIRWAATNAAPTMALLFKHGGDAFLEFVTGTKVPQRLRKFSQDHVARSVAESLNSIFKAPGVAATPGQA